MLGHHWHASETPFNWRFAGQCWPTFYGIWIRSSGKKIKKEKDRILKKKQQQQKSNGKFKKCQLWRISSKQDKQILTFFPLCIRVLRERSGSVVECLTRDRRAADASLTGFTALCPWARHINPSLVLVQPRKNRPDVIERVLTGT